MHSRLRPSPATVIAVIALFVSLGGTAAALSGRNNVDHNDLRRHVVHTGKIHNGAVTSGKVDDFGLRLHDLGGFRNNGTSTVNPTINVPNGACRMRLVDGGNPAPRGLIGSLVVGFLTDDQGEAVLNNLGAVLPTIVSETSQGGAFANLVVCDYGGGGQTVPAGSVFHYRIIGP